MPTSRCIQAACRPSLSLLKSLYCKPAFCCRGGRTPARNGDFREENLLRLLSGRAAPHVANAQVSQIKNWKCTAHNENDVTWHAQPFEYRVDTGANVVEGTRVIITHAN